MPARRSRLAVLLGLLAAAVALRGLAGFFPASEPEMTELPPPRRPDTPEVAALRAAAEKIRPLFGKLPPPRPGDWLDKHTEFGQSFDSYLMERPVPVVQRFRRLYVQPLGEFSPAQHRLLELTAAFLERFFGMEVALLGALPLGDLPESARRAGDTREDDQVLTSYLLNEVLLPRRPEDAAGVLGLIAADLWPGPGWNYVFGQASLSERIGVWSLHRFGDPDAGPEAFAQCLRRTLGTAVHETGHMLGIQHCIAFECRMNGSNHLEESDRRPLEFCPECQPKVWWGCDVDPLARCERLAEFGEMHGLERDAALWRRQLLRFRE